MYKPIDMDSLKLNNNFKWVVTKDNFFTKEECEYIIEKADKYSERKKTKYRLRKLKTRSLIRIQPNQVSSWLRIFNRIKANQISKLLTQMIK